jgi:hypothetical protein
MGMLKPELITPCESALRPEVKSNTTTLQLNYWSQLEVHEPERMASDRNVLSERKKLMHHRRRVNGKQISVDRTFNASRKR